MPSSLYLNSKEASDHLRVSQRTLARLAIPKIKLGRRVIYQLDDLTAYALRNKTMPLEAVAPSLTRAAIQKVTKGIATRIKSPGGDPDARYRQRLAMLNAA